MQWRITGQGCRWLLAASLCVFVGCSADDPKGGSGEGDGNLRDSGRTIDIEDAGPPDASTDPDATLIMDCEEGETRPCGSDEGECVAGIQVCNQGLWSQICDGEVVPAAERCDGLDNDCDGTPDEALGLGRNCKLEDEFNREVDGLRVCDFATGETVCREVDDCEEDSDGDGFNVCQDCDDEDPRNFPGNDELCDGQDNDCDGFVDPRFDLGEVCYSGQGACRRGGTIVCDEFGVDQVCDALPGQPEGEEICGDEVDNDCDGTLDEGLGLGEACTVGVGACVRDGVRVCAEDRTASECDAEPGVPGDELCGDETDNDCDGRQDEGFDLGSSCTSGRGACAAEGRIVCVEGGRSECDAEAGQPSEELCGDGVDNDCDGQEDEDFDLGTDCVVGVGECARDGRRVCNEDGTGVLCDVIMGEPVAELCGDGVDNDCDGRADEGFAQLGRPCTSGQGQCAREGLFQCSGDRRSAICDAVAGPAAAELCDALDNDCDGTADEGYLLQEPCVSGQGLCRAEGFTVCAGDGRAVTCGAVPLPPQPELCDEEDNDCDGMVDEDFPDIGLPCDSEDDPDLCPYGVWGCDLRTRQLACLDDVPSPEICNFMDDDCDGVPDNGIDLFTDENNCGNCGIVCPAPYGECRDAVCYCDYWVDDDGGSNANGNGSRLSPWRTITHAVANSGGGECDPRVRINVLPGEYSQTMHPQEIEVFPIGMRDGLEIVGFGQPQPNPAEDHPGIVVNPAHLSGAFIVDGTTDPRTILQRLYILDGGIGGQIGSLPAVKAMDATLTMRDVYVVSASTFAGNAAAIQTDGGVVVIDHCTFRENGPWLTIRMSSGEVFITRSQFSDNGGSPADTRTAVVAANGGVMSIENSVFINNDGHAIGVDFEASVEVTHSSIAGNAGRGLVVRRSASASVYNSVFAFNAQPALSIHAAEATLGEVINNVIWSNEAPLWTAADGNLSLAAVNGLAGARDNFSADPTFLSLPSDNVRVRPGSPLIDAADALYTPAIDLDGVPRPLGAGPDVGAFESPFAP